MRLVGCSTPSAGVSSARAATFRSATRTSSRAPRSRRASRWSRSAEAILALGIGGAFVLLFLSFRVVRAPHSVMAHGVWVLSTLLLVSFAARVALGRGPVARAAIASGSTRPLRRWPLSSSRVALGVCTRCSSARPAMRVADVVSHRLVGRGHWRVRRWFVRSRRSARSVGNLLARGRVRCAARFHQHVATERRAPVDAARLTPCAWWRQSSAARGVTPPAPRERRALSGTRSPRSARDRSTRARSNASPRRSGSSRAQHSRTPSPTRCSQPRPASAFPPPRARPSLEPRSLARCSRSWRAGRRRQVPPRTRKSSQISAERWVDLDRPEAVRVATPSRCDPKTAIPRAPATWRKRSATRSRACARPRTSSRPSKRRPKARSRSRRRASPLHRRRRPRLQRRRPYFPAAISSSETFARAANALKSPGDLSPVVETSFGYHVIFLEVRSACADASRSRIDGARLAEELLARAAAAKAGLLASLARRPGRGAARRGRAHGAARAMKIRSKRLGVATRA